MFVLLECFTNEKGELTILTITSYPDILWARHVIFLSHGPLFARVQITTADFALKISWRSRENHFRVNWRRLIV